MRLRVFSPRLAELRALRDRTLYRCVACHVERKGARLSWPARPFVVYVPHVLDSGGEVIRGAMLPHGPFPADSPVCPHHTRHRAAETP